MNEIANRPLEGIVVEVACYMHRDMGDCRGEFHRQVEDPYVAELDGETVLIDVCQRGFEQLCDDI